AGCRRAARALGFARSFLVHLARVKHALADDSHGVAFHFAEEATRVTLVAGGAADLVDLEQDGGGVAVDIHAAHLLDVAALLALAPKAVATAAEVTRAPGAQRLLVGFAVHPGEHQHRAGVRVLGNGRDQTA